MSTSNHQSKNPDLSRNTLYSIASLDKKLLRLFAFIMALTCWNVSAKEMFEIRTVNNVPKLFHNANQLFPGMLYVNPIFNQRIMQLNDKWQNYTLQFTAPADVSAHLYLRFNASEEKSNFEAWFSKMEIIDMTAGKAVDKTNEWLDFKEKLHPRWTFHCARKTPQLPVVFATGKIDKDQSVLHIKVSPHKDLTRLAFILPGIQFKKNHQYQVNITGRANRIIPFVPYVQEYGGHWLTLDRSVLAEQVKSAARAGINLITFPVPGGWKHPSGKINDFQLDNYCRAILQANPNAQLIPRVSLGFGLLSPSWWKDEYKEETMWFDNGKGNHPSIASERYQQDAENALRHVIRYCEKNFPDNMAGYHPAGGETNEWFYNDAYGRPLNGYDPATIKAWRKWLTNKYHTDEALQSAWNIRNVSLSTIATPTPDERKASPEIGLRNPAESQKIIDFVSFQQDSMADFTCRLARAVREEAGQGRLSLLFYGYVFEFAGMPLGPGSSGHFALRKILDSADIDILSGPFSYRERMVNGSTAIMSASESIMLAGKLWLNEDDTRTHIESNWFEHQLDGAAMHIKTEDETRHVIRRNMALNISRNLGTWWMDLHGRGWFNEEWLWQEMGQFIKLADALNLPPYTPDIAAIVDEYSMRFSSSAYSSDPTTARLISFGRSDLARIGAPYGQYLLDDVVHGKVHSKLNVFLSAYALNQTQREQLSKLRNKIAAVWCWAPGYIDLDCNKFSTNAVTELTGFKVRDISGEASLLVNSTAKGIKMGLPESFGIDKIIHPTLSPVPENGDLVLAKYANGAPAVVFRPGIVPSLFCGTTVIPPPLYRIIAKAAGVHLYTERDAYVFANGYMIALSVPVAGSYRIDFGRTITMTEVFDKSIHSNVSQLQLDLKPGNMKIYEIKH